MKIISIHAENVDKTGFFCMMSKKKSPGYQAKLNWIKERFVEGMELFMLDLKQGGRGFIETIPAEKAWRPIVAPGYLAIQCIWVVGKSKGNGYGQLLLDHVVNKAKVEGYRGVVMVTSDKVWLSHRNLFDKNGFEEMASAPPSFQLMVKRFYDDAPIPTFTNQWEEKAAKYPKGFTVFYSAQCPYMIDAVRTVEEFATENHHEFQSIELQNAEEVREKSPTAYGTFAIIFNGKLFSYHYELKKDIAKKMSEL